MGQWSLLLSSSQRLIEGAHTVAAVATDAAGNVSAEASQPFTVRLPVDAGSDAGVDGGRDAGGIEDGGVEPLTSNVGLQGGGCGCASGGDVSAGFVLLALLAWRRRAAR